MPEVLFSVEPPLAFLTFNRPAARNALTWAMYDGLVDACETVDTRADLRVLIIRGAGQSFAAGTDISQFTTLKSPEDGIAYERRLDDVIDRLDKVTKDDIRRVASTTFQDQNRTVAMIVNQPGNQSGNKPGDAPQGR